MKKNQFLKRILALVLSATMVLSPAVSYAGEFDIDAGDWAVVEESVIETAGFEALEEAVFETPVEEPVYEEETATEWADYADENAGDELEWYNEIAVDEQALEQNSSVDDVYSAIEGSISGDDSEEIIDYIETPSLDETQDDFASDEANYATTYKAKIGDTQYETAQDALDAAKDGDTVTLYNYDHGILYFRQCPANSVGVDVTKQEGENYGTNDLYRHINNVSIVGLTGASGSFDFVKVFYHI